nr:prenyltransferase/squalene oxidase repeat-containing protein [Rhodopirellula sp. JC639]
MRIESDYDRPRVESTPTDSARMWPLDLSVVTLAGLVLFLIATPFRFDDPRLLYNATTYLVGIICVAVILSLVLRAITSRFLRKAILLGLLFSISVHLLLLIFAIHYVVFAAYQPLASKGEKRERTPIRKTVPEHIFQAPKESKETPDWSKPVDAETKSREIPKEQRQLPPVERSQPRLEVPKPRQPENQPMQKFLMQRNQPSASEPMPADAPGKLARRESNAPAPKPQAESIEVPSPAQEIASPVPAAPAERKLADNATPSASRQAAARLDMPAVVPQPSESIQTPRATPAATSLSANESMPTIGDAGLARARRSRTIAQPSAVAGAAPAPVVVSVARASDEASLMLSPTDIPTETRGETTGAQITLGPAPSFMTETAPVSPTGGARVARNTLSAAVGAPNVNAGPATRAPGRGRRMNVVRGSSPMGTMTPAESVPASAAGIAGAAPSDQLDDRLGASDAVVGREGESGGAATAELAPAGAPAMALDLLADIGPVGISDTLAPSAGLIPSDAQPEIAAMELPREARPRRQVGGPATPAGTKIAAVESFSRRVMRTSGGAASSAPGMGGPATEEAIERGLAYLASVQNDDGSWSLQGHGDRVILRSDTAATGLCLLAFQGAGYTHTQHQYAGTVSKGLKFLLDNQRTSGNLYRSENELSDRNVMFYSHGIAALALCEAYGMTQDRELRQGAQESLNYIMATQHRSYGGWRYSPQVSSDTSVTGWMMMALKSGDLSGLDVSQAAYDGIDHWLSLARGDGPERLDRYRYNPFAADTPQQRHGRLPTPTMTAVGMLMRMYNGWSREQPEMQSAAEYLLKYPPRLGERRRPLRDGYYWYYATQFMFHMGGDYWDRWNQYLNPLLLETQIKVGPEAGSWDPELPIPDRWSAHAGRLYVTTMNLLNLEVYYRHLPIYEDTAAK